MAVAIPCISINFQPSTQSPSEWLPALDSGLGQNYFDREWQLQYLILKGEFTISVWIPYYFFIYIYT